MIAAIGLWTAVANPALADDDPSTPPGPAPIETGDVDGALVAVGQPPVPPTTVVVAVGLPPVPPPAVAVGRPPVPPTRPATPATPATPAAPATTPHAPATPATPATPAAPATTPHAPATPATPATPPMQLPEASAARAQAAVADLVASVHDAVRSIAPRA